MSSVLLRPLFLIKKKNTRWVNPALYYYSRIHVLTIRLVCWDNKGVKHGELWPNFVLIKVC